MSLLLAFLCLFSQVVIDRNAAKIIKNIINEDKNTVNIEATKDRDDVLGGQFKGGGQQVLDFTDINQLSKKDGATAESLVVHETVEAYKGLQAGVFPGGQLTESLHNAGIDAENLVRAEQGLQPRGPFSTELNYLSTQRVYIIDFTTHREKITVDQAAPGKIRSVEVIKKQP